MDEVYLVGEAWYNPTMGDFPNCGSFPYAVFTDLKKAEELYTTLAVNDDNSGKAYLVEMPIGVRIRPTVLKGSNPIF